MLFLPALPPFFALIFSLLPLYVWWVKRFDHLRPIAGLSFFSIAAGMVLPTLPWVAFTFGIVSLFFSGKPVDHPHVSMRFKNRWIKFPLEAFGLWVIYAFFKILPVRLASNAGAALGRFIGTKLKRRTQLALRNLSLILPNTDHQKILRAMWENFGRTIGELPHIKTVAKYTTVKGFEHLKALQGKPYLIAMAHLNSLGLAAKPFGELGQHAYVFMRTANNPLTAIFLKKAFGNDLSPSSFLPKGRIGMSKAVNALSRNIPVTIASDLYIKGGDRLTFMGHPAITSPVMTKLAQKFKCPVVPVRIVRGKGLHHTVEICKPMYNPTMQQVNDLIGTWVKEHPEQWFWLNNRWHQD